MSKPNFDLTAAAGREMTEEGFEPDFPPGVDAQLREIRARVTYPAPLALQDLRNLLWSSIDNDTSRDLDQIEFAERVPAGTRVLVGIADVDSAVGAGSPIDTHAARETVTVYTPVRNFPMLPEALSTDLTSLNEKADRTAVVIEMVIAADGAVVSSQIYRAVVRNQAQLTYNSVGPWLEGRAAPDAKVSASPELQAQLKLQDEAAAAMRMERHRSGSLSFDRAEAIPVIKDGQVQSLETARRTRANDLIEEFMVTANVVMAQTLKSSGSSSIRRVVKSPERWPRIVALAAQYGETLPRQPDSGALSRFLEKRKAVDPVHYADLSLAIVKLMGPGQYVMIRAGDSGEGHFGLATLDYTHSTAPNRRFSDLVTQRLIKAVIAKTPVPYTDDDLSAIAQNCTAKEEAARKVERVMGKRVAALAMQGSVGQTFGAIVTGVGPKGVFVRVPDPPIEGILCRGQAGVDVGDQLRVTLLAADPERGYIDFARAAVPAAPQ